MTTLREAAQQALDAWDTRAGLDTASKAFEALRAALAEPVDQTTLDVSGTTCFSPAPAEWPERSVKEEEQPR